MGLKHLGLGALLALAAHAATAETTITVTALTDYDFRGISQTEGDPALQASIDYAGEHFYATVWGSNVDFGDDVDGNIEVDLVAGFAGETGGGLRWDVGATWYTYPGSDQDLGDPDDEADDVFESANYWEYSLGLGMGPVDIKYWFSPDLYDSGETASYLEANASFGLPAELSLNLHAGYSAGDYFDALEDAAAESDPGYPGDDADYYDFSIGLARSFGRFDFEAKYVANLNDGKYWDVENGALQNDERAILSVSTTFPWADEEAE
jgi:uncharacterized protein (TIGR02001 family)